MLRRLSQLMIALCVIYAVYQGFLYFFSPIPSVVVEPRIGIIVQGHSDGSETVLYQRRN